MAFYDWFKTQSFSFSFLAAQLKKPIPKEKFVQGLSASVVHFQTFSNFPMPKTEMKPIQCWTIPPPLFLCITLKDLMFHTEIIMFIKCFFFQISHVTDLYISSYLKFIHQVVKVIVKVQEIFKTRCRPSKGRRCIPDVIIEVHVETHLNVYG